VLANAIISGIVKRSVGYEANFAVWQLIFFLLARPRLSWICMAVLAGAFGETVSTPSASMQHMSVEQHQLLGHPSPPGQNMFDHSAPNASMHEISRDITNQSNTSLSRGIYANEYHDDPVTGPTQVPVERKWDLPYHNTFLSAIIAEVIMQLAALYIMGITVRFAWERGYYNVGFNRNLYK
jgi:hypothetical protein